MVNVRAYNIDNMQISADKKYGSKFVFGEKDFSFIKDYINCAYIHCTYSISKWTEASLRDSVR